MYPAPAGHPACPPNGSQHLQARLRLNSYALGFAFSTGKPLTRTVWVSSALAAVAFAIWSLSVPMNGWQSITLIATNKGAVAVGAALAGILFGYLAEGITKRTFR